MVLIIFIQRHTTFHAISLFPPHILLYIWRHIYNHYQTVTNLLFCLGGIAFPVLEEDVVEVAVDNAAASGVVDVESGTMDSSDGGLPEKVPRWESSTPFSFSSWLSHVGFPRFESITISDRHLCLSCSAVVSGVDKAAKGRETWISAMSRRIDAIVAWSPFASPRQWSLIWKQVYAVCTSSSLFKWTINKDITSSAVRKACLEIPFKYNNGFCMKRCGNGFES